MEKDRRCLADFLSVISQRGSEEMKPYRSSWVVTSPIESEHISDFHYLEQLRRQRVCLVQKYEKFNSEISWCFTSSYTDPHSKVAWVFLFFIFLVACSVSSQTAYTRARCVCQCSKGSGVKAEFVLEERKGLRSRLLSLLPAVSPQEQPASVWLHVIDSHALSSMRIESDLKQALPSLSEWLSSPPPPNLRRSLKRERVSRTWNMAASGSTTRGHSSLEKW